MKVLAIAIGLLLAAVGLVGIVAPSFIVDVGRSLLIPIALYIVAAFRIGVGVVLLLVAADSRLPTALRIFGIVIILVGVFTLFLGIEHSRTILDWWSNQGPLFTRFCLAAPLVMGLVIIYALTAPRRTAA